MEAECVRVALPRQYRRSTRALACPQHRALRAIFIDDDDRMIAKLGLVAPRQLER
jgi:hypothetical protein